MLKNKIKYNNNIADDILNHGNFSALILFYILKVTHENSVIYNSDLKVLFQKYKVVKILPKSFSFDRFEKTMFLLFKLKYLTVTKNNHISIYSLNNDIGYYRSKITYNDVNWNTMKALLVKEGLKHTKYKQEQAISFRDDIATRKKKAYIWLKTSKKKKKSYDQMSESYSKKILFTYKSISIKYGISITEVHNIIEFLKSKNHIETKVLKIRHGKVICKLDFIKDIVDFKSYSYIDKYNVLVSIVGTSIININ
jgi:hypothetical protein